MATDEYWTPGIQQVYLLTHLTTFYMTQQGVLWSVNYMILLSCWGPTPGVDNMTLLSKTLRCQFHDSVESVSLVPYSVVLVIWYYWVRLCGFNYMTLRMRHTLRCQLHDTVESYSAVSITWHCWVVLCGVNYMTLLSRTLRCQLHDTVESYSAVSITWHCWVVLCGVNYMTLLSQTLRCQFYDRVESISVVPIIWRCYQSALHGGTAES
jgi:hypothetical protein